MADAKVPNTGNEFALMPGANLPNHSTSLAGRGKYVRQGQPEVPTFRTKQQAFRYAVYLILLAEQHLPDEEGSEEHTFDMLHDAIRNT